MPDNPDRHELSRGPLFWKAFVVALFGLTLVVLSATGFVPGMFRFGRGIVLRENGLMRTAKVTRLTGGYKQPWTAFWRDETGQTGKIVRMWQSSLPEIGSTITIYADATGRFPSVWEGDCGAR